MNRTRMTERLADEFFRLEIPQARLPEPIGALVEVPDLVAARRQEGLAVGADGGGMDSQSPSFRRRFRRRRRLEPATRVQIASEERIPGSQVRPDGVRQSVV